MKKSVQSPPRSRKPSAISSAAWNRRVTEKAYQLYQQRGGAHGGDQADWFEAERLLLHEEGARQEQAAARPAAAGNRTAKPRTTATRPKKPGRARARRS